MKEIMNFIDKASIVHTIAIIIQCVRDVDFWCCGGAHGPAPLL
jgi:hypothetical protein